MGKSYRPYLPDQEFLLPPSLRDWLPENHLVYFVSDVVDNLNLSAMDAVYGDEQRGQPPYDPRMMTKLLVYGYCVGLFSSRRIQQRLTEDIAFRVLAAGNTPNFRTISDFRKIHLATLEGLFEQVLKIALEAGAMKLGRVALDGTKVKANASKHKAMSYDRMREKERQIRAEVRELLAQSRSGRQRRRRAVWGGPARRRVTGRVAAAGNTAEEDSGSETGAGGAGTAEGGGGRKGGRGSETGQARRQGSV